jgi:hypothetical protein
MGSKNAAVTDRRHAQACHFHFWQFGHATHYRQPQIGPEGPH